MFVIFGLSLFAQAKGGLPAEVFYKKGKALHQAGDLHTAIEFYDMALQMDAYHPDALFNRGVAYASLNLPKRQKAWNDINKVLNINPEDSEALLWRAELSFDLKKYALAAQDYTTLLLHNQHDYRFFINRGLSYAELAQFEFAQRDFDAALRLDQQLPIAWAGKGQCAFEMQNYEEAITCYINALELAPSEMQYEYALSESLVKNKQFEDAKSILEKLILKNENASAKSMVTLAFCYLNLEEIENAKILAGAAMKKDLRNAESYRVLGMIAFSEKKYERAKTYFLEATAWAEDYTEAYKNVAQIFLIQKEYGPAKSYADEAIRMDARSGGAFYIRALAHEGLDMLTEACTDFSKAQSLGFEVHEAAFSSCE